MANKGFKLPEYQIAQPNPYLLQLNNYKKYELNNDSKQRFWNYADAIEIDYAHVTRDFLRITPPINQAVQNILTDIFIKKEVSDDIVSDDIKDKLIILMLLYKGTRLFPIQYHLYSLLRPLDYTNWGWGDYFKVGSNVPKTSEWFVKIPRVTTGGKKVEKPKQEKTKIRVASSSKVKLQRKLK